MDEGVVKAAKASLIIVSQESAWNRYIKKRQETNIV